MNNKELFKKNKYCTIDGVISKETLSIIEKYALFDEKNNFSPENVDQQVPGNHSVYADPIMESLLSYLLPVIEENTGLDLYPTYSYYRVYRSGGELKPHIDRDSCEITASLMIAKKYTDKNYSWPLFVEGNGFAMEEGDMLIYRGMELNHYRYPLEVQNNDYHIQCFLHYVDKNGIFANCKYDGREDIGIKK